MAKQKTSYAPTGSALGVRGAINFYHFGVLEYVVMIEILYPKGTSYRRTTKQMKISMPFG